LLPPPPPPPPGPGVARKTVRDWVRLRGGFVLREICDDDGERERQDVADRRCAKRTSKPLFVLVSVGEEQRAGEEFLRGIHGKAMVSLYCR
jgi:hypothetical protein